MIIQIYRSRGASLVEVMVVFVVLSVMLAYTLPSNVNQVIRSKVEQSLKLAGPAQEALMKTCGANETATVKTNLDAGYFYIPTGTDEDYVNKIILGADCSKRSMVILIWTASTGAETDPVLELNANGPGDNGSWTCRIIRGELRHVPDACRS